MDAAGKSGWKSLSELLEDEELITQVGFLIKKTKDIYILCAGYYWDVDDKDYKHGSSDIIPRGMVKSFKILVSKNVAKSTRKTKETT